MHSEQLLLEFIKDVTNNIKYVKECEEFVVKHLSSYGYCTSNESGNLEVFYKEESGIIFNRNPKEKRVEFTNKGWKSVSDGKFCLKTVHKIVRYFYNSESTDNCKVWLALNNAISSYNFNTITK